MTDLERDLVTLGASLDVPADDLLAVRVRQAIAAPRPRLPRRVLIAIAAAALGAGVLAAPSVADWLGVGGVEVKYEPPPRSPSPGVVLELGRRTTLGAAANAAGFDVAVPRALGAPDEVWIDSSNSAPIVWLAYRARPGLSSALATGYGALLFESKLAVSDELIATKFAEPSTKIEPVDVGTGRALWVQGAHYIALRNGDEDVIVDRLRLSDNVLLWERGAITMRFESALGREESLRVARSVP